MDVLLGWLDRIDNVAIKGILIQSVLMGIPGMVLGKISQVLDLQDAWVGLSFLTLGYISISLIRFFRMDSQNGFISLRDTLLRKLLERGLDLYAKELQTRGKRAKSDEDEKIEWPLYRVSNTEK